MESDLIEEEVIYYLAVTFGRNVIIFGVDMSSSVQFDQKGKVSTLINILILVKVQHKD